MKKFIKKLGSILALFSIFTFIVTLYFSAPVYAAPGDLDPTFGVGGKVTTDFIGQDDYGASTAIQSDGKIVVGGSAKASPGGGLVFALVRYNNNGTLDTGFGTAGKVTTTFNIQGESSGNINDLKIQPDNKIIAVGLLNTTYPSQPTADLALVRYNYNGTLDNSFGNGGKVVARIGDSSASEVFGNIIIQPDGKILLAGYVSYPNFGGENFTLIRLTENGTRDSGFGNNGIVSTDIISGSRDIISNLILQPDGKILAGGSATTFNPNTSTYSRYFAFTRYNTDGSLDASFGNNGKVTTQLGGGVSSVVLLQDNRFLGVGVTYVGNDAYLVVARYNPNGSIDTTFNSVGSLITICFDGTFCPVGNMTLQPNGKFVGIGEKFNSTTFSDFVLARYNQDWTPDVTFGNNGIVTTDFANSSDSASSATKDSLGRFIIAGSTYQNGNYNFATARYLSENISPVANAGQDQTTNESQSITLDGSASTDPDGQSDIVSYSWNFGDGNTGNGAIVNYTYADNGIYTATLTVTDTAGATSTDSATITINNIAPIVGEITAPIDPQQVGTTISASASFTDPGILDTHIAIWNWGDGTTSVGTVSESAGSGTVSGNHTYSTPDVYTLTLTVTDKDGGSATTTFQYIVIYNPGGGFVTGGGWINSGSGKVNFGFNSKYEDGATVPTGQTKLNFKLADFNFHSISYEWLVVSGSKAQYKGSGTVNGIGDYGFILTANDQPDKFRLKAWDKMTGNVLYDTQPGDDDNANASTVIDAGSIIIHN